MEWLWAMANNSQKDVKSPLSSKYDKAPILFYAQVVLAKVAKHTQWTFPTKVYANPYVSLFGNLSHLSIRLYYRQPRPKNLKL
jgi:hypothetical protein